MENKKEIIFDNNPEPNYSDLDLAFIRKQDDIFTRFTTNYTVTHAKVLSKREREDKMLNSLSLVYGEIEFDPFAITIEKIKKRFGGLAKPNCIFYDVGSGSGKAVFAAAMLHSFSRCTGIEILDSLHQLSNEIKGVFETDVIPYMESPCCSNITFVKDDILLYDWKDGDLIFANSTCFTTELLKQIAEKAEELKSGSFFITFTKKLPSDQFIVLDHYRYRMSWGDATVFIQKKI